MPSATKMVNLKVILNNFNKLVKNRGIVAPRYDQLLTVSDVDLELYLTEEFRLAEDKTDPISKVRAAGNSFESTLTDVVEHEGKKILFFWSTFDGKTFTVGDIKTVLNLANKFDVDYSFIVSLYDNFPNYQTIFALKELEFFNFTDLLIDYHDNIYAPESCQVFDYEDFLETNPDLEGYELPRIHLNDFQARYVGAKTGQVIQSVRSMMLPNTFIDSDLTFRRVDRTLTKNPYPLSNSRYDAF